MPRQGFHITNAAAGSGKTFSLVSSYLEQLLATPQKDNYQYLLAMTFTNKAVNEMKERILKVLSQLARGSPNEMGTLLRERLNISAEELQWRAEVKLRSLLHNFGAFEVTTLDSFTHRIIRTFSFDLGLSQSFEVVIDSQFFIQSIVDLLIHKVGVSLELTHLLTAFSLQKVADEKSWDIAHDLNEFAPVLLNENDRFALRAIKEIPLETFQSDREKIEELGSQLKRQIQKQAQRVLRQLKEKGMDETVFTRKTLTNHFRRLSEFTEKSPSKIRSWFGTQLESQLQAGSGFFKKGIPAQQEILLEKMTPQLLSDFQETKNNTFQYLLSRAIINQWVPLSLLGALERELEQQQNIQNRMLLGRFNERIASVVQQQPIPFIYERLGTRYRHFFIDEFQDTSVLQWRNLIPLIANALEGQEAGSLLLVGDPKQAIYRWRGGDVQQYFDLLKAVSPFQCKPELKRLETNYRSYHNLIAFNNSFFSFASQYLKDPIHKELFSNDLQQKHTDKKGGTVAVHRIEDKSTQTERGALYTQKVVQLVKQLQNEGYDRTDITVLIRKKKQAQGIVTALQSASIPAISSDSLLLSASEKVQWVLHLFRLSLYPSDLASMKGVLHGIWQWKNQSDDYHSFMIKYLKSHAMSFFQALNADFNWSYDLSFHRKLTVYEGLEYIFDCFSELLHTDSYTQRLFDVIFYFTQQQSTHTNDFLDYWNREQAQLTIDLPTLTDAIQVMTVHKSKGLEFPVVIYPYLEDSLQPSNGDPLWFPLDNTTVPWARLSFSEVLASYGDTGAHLYEERKKKAALDSMNLLYVGLTRAVSQMHLITKEQKKPPKHPTYASLLNDFIAKNCDSETLPETFYWSSDATPIPHSKTLPKGIEALEESNLQWRNKLMPVRIKDVAARDYGILIHDLLGNLRVADQLDWVLSTAVLEGKIKDGDVSKTKKLLAEVVSHPKLKDAFDKTAKVWVEQDILLPDGRSLRPDRILFNAHQVVLMDFKTGRPKEADKKQIEEYGHVIQNMGYQVGIHHLVYINEGVTVVSF